jgi:hypothetical protein
MVTKDGIVTGLNIDQLVVPLSTPFQFTPFMGDDMNIHCPTAPATQSRALSPSH